VCEGWSVEVIIIKIGKEKATEIERRNRAATLESVALPKEGIYRLRNCLDGNKEGSFPS
jgi:hypothetical protein